MTATDAIKIIKSECYVFNPMNFDRMSLVNTALDTAVKALQRMIEDDKRETGEENEKRTHENL